MNELINILLFIYAILGSILLLGFVLQKKKESTCFTDKKEKIHLDDLIIIIPFRNEQDRISPLIESIKQLANHPQKFVFVNDHSTDDTVSKIHALKEKVPYEILDLPIHLQGKKQAIQFGIKHSISEYTLTWDADISFPSNYFRGIEQLEKKDLYILPVIMKGHTVKELFFESDHAIANAINASVSGLYRPFLASGANLLFKQDCYLQYHQLDKHIHIASGDDLFLLRDFRENKKDIQLLTNHNLSITTESPTSFKEFINQRLRWISKGNEVGDQLSNVLAILSLLFNLAFYSIYIFLIYKQSWQFLIFIFGCKMIIDQIVYLSYFIKINRIITWMLLPLFSIIQPVYLLVLVAMLPFYKTKWKGRRV